MPPARLHRRGWDIAADRNHRLADCEDRALAFPTLRELADTVDGVVDALGFDPEARDRVRGSLATRINGLRVGSKGALFDTRTPLSMAALLGGPPSWSSSVSPTRRTRRSSSGCSSSGWSEFRRAERQAGRRGAVRRPTARAGDRGGPPAAGERRRRRERTPRGRWPSSPSRTCSPRSVPTGRGSSCSTRCRRSSPRTSSRTRTSRSPTGSWTRPTERYSVARWP